MKVTILGCETPAGIYYVEKFEHSEAIPKAAEEPLLDLTRNLLAADFKGRVFNEKKVRFEGKPGRDFVVQGKEPGVGTVTVRVRMYLSGKSIYAMLVASEPNKDVPKDAGRFLGSLAFGVAKAGATAKK